MNIWFIVILLLSAMDLGVAMAKHGERRKFNFWETSISIAIQIFIIYKAIQVGF